VVLAPLDDIII